MPGLPYSVNKKTNISDTQKDGKHNEPSIANLAWETKHLNIGEDSWGPFHDPIFLCHSQGYHYSDFSVYFSHAYFYTLFIYIVPNNIPMQSTELFFMFLNFIWMILYAAFCSFFQ